MLGKLGVTVLVTVIVSVELQEVVSIMSKSERVLYSEQSL